MFHVDTILTVCKSDLAIKEWTPLTLKVWLSAFKCRRINNTTREYLIKWFKHYSDNYRGRSVHGLFDELGHIGVASYYITLEICAEKLTKVQDKDLESSDFYFGFSERFLRQNLRISSTKLQQFLNICSTFGLLSYKKDKNNYEIFMPILLDLLDSDFKKTRSRRESDASKTPLDREEDLKRERDKNKELDIMSRELLDYWNSINELPKIKTISDDRIKKMKSRLNEFGFDKIKECFILVVASDFLIGKKTDWRADIDFVIKNKKTMQKILDNEYGNTSQVQKFSKNSAQGIFDTAREQIEKIKRGEL
jgi:hypothetical protein